MKIFVKDNFNPRAFGGWFLIPLYVPVAIFLMDALTGNIAALILIMSFAMIIPASLIGKSYIVSLFAMAIIYALINLWTIGLDYMALDMAIALTIASLTISFIVVSYYKRALNFFNQQYFWLNIETLDKNTKKVRNILWPLILFTSLGVTILALMKFIIMPNWGFVDIVDYALFVTVASFATFFCTFIIGYRRKLILLILSAPVFIFLCIVALPFNIPFCIFIAGIGYAIISYYGNDNKISFVKVVKYVFKKDRGVNI